MKRIFRKNFLFFWFYILSFLSFIVLPVYSIAEDDDDIEWLDEEDEEDEEIEEEDRVADKEKTDDEEDEDEEIEEEIADKEEGDTEESTDAVDEDTSNVGVADEDTEIESGAKAVMDEYERNLYETYIQYYSKRVSQEEWNGVIGTKDTYVVQPNDTLWDISQVLFGDPNYWPKLWSVNPSLTNPHLIQPNDNLGFIYGTEGTPPALTVIQGGAKQVGKDSPPQPPLPNFLKGKAIVVPLSSNKVKPVLKSIPSSLPPLYSSSHQRTELDTMDIIFKKVTLPKLSFLHYYMSAEPLSGQGIVSDKKDYGSLFHVGQRVILEMRDPVNPGQKLAVVKDMGKLYPSLFGVRGPFGYQVEVQGELEVVGRVPDSFDLYEAKVIKSLNPISIGSLVLDKSLIQFDYQTTDLVGTSEAQIIGVPGPENYERTIASPYSLVYLNRGMGSGISVGQMYQIRANPDIKRKQEYGYDVKLGEVKIVYVDDRFATGLITQMSNPVHVGDYMVSLSQGLSMQQGYDPFEEVGDVGVEESSPSAIGPIDEDDMDFEDFEDAEDSIGDVSKVGVPETFDQEGIIGEESDDDDPYGDEDTFEAFE